MSIYDSEFVQVEIEGVIPLRISKLLKLEVLRIAAHMTSPIPLTIGSLVNLRVLSLELSVLTSDIPQTLCNLTSLQELTLKAFTSVPIPIQGDIPFLSHPTLEVLQLQRTQIRGFPAGVLLPKLRVLSLLNNPKLSWPFAPTDPLDSLESITIMNSPEVRGQLTTYLPSVREFIIRSYALGGELSSAFWSNAMKLEVFNLDAPRFTGFIDAGNGAKCALTELSILSTALSAPITSSIGNCKRLRLLSIVDCALPGPLPSEMGLLRSLRSIIIRHAIKLGPLFPSLMNSTDELSPSLEIISSGLTGTVPALAPNFYRIDLSDNELEGQLPPIRCSRCSFAGNKLSGSIPLVMAHYASSIDVSRNMLGPTIVKDLFSHEDHAIALNLSLNSFEGFLPDLPYSVDKPFYNTLSVDVSHNKFIGNLPPSWGHYKVYASDNELSGDLTGLFSNYTSKVLHLSHNRFQGSVPAMIHMEQLLDLDLSHNMLSDGQFGLPPLPPKLQYFRASHNRFSEFITTMFINSVESGSLILLDLSYNQLRCGSTVPIWLRTTWLSSLLNSTAHVINLSHNRLSCVFNPIMAEHSVPEGVFIDKLTSVLMLDLSHNQLSSVFNPAIFTSLVALDLSHNLFTSISLTRSRYQAITQLDISHNHIKFDVASVADLPFLYNLKAQNNSIHGRLTLTDLPKLESLDLSDNLLDVEPSWSSIGSHFLNQSLKTLSLVMNPQIPRAQALHTNTTGLAKTSSSSPSRELSGATCFSLSFYNTTNIAFAFDESLFNFVQCDCDHEHFGKPPFWCEQCPSLVDPETGVASGVEECGGPRMLVGLNSFVTAKQVNKSEDGTPVFGFETQSCLYTPDRVLTKVSNCLGLQMTADRLQNLSALPEVLSTQCVLGSEGRLCAECMCDWRSTRPVCYYEKAQQCQKCSRVLPSSSFVALIVGGLIAMLVVGTIVVVLVLRSKRVQKRTAWSKLSLLKRLFYRLLFMTSLGNISILLTFVQLFMELTHWDSYAIGRVLQLMNLNGESIGLRCLFPFLSDPVLGLGVRLSLPFVACILVVVCVVLAEVASKLFSMLSEHRSTSSVRNMHLNDHGEENMPLNVSKSPWQDIGSSDFESHGSPSSDIQSDWMTTSTGLTPRDIVIAYPTLAMMTSTLITVTRFLYFGTALTAHEYFFSTMDRQSGAYYVQNAPWILIDTARTQRWLSIPVAILFDAVLPAGFLYLCFRLRHKIGHDETGYYLGTLFTSFKPSFYWWEIVNIAKKVSIALVLRGIPSSNVLQVTLIVTILAGFQVIQTSVSPWRRKTENLLDALGSLVLVGALLAARSGRYENSFVSVYYVVAFSALYVIGSLIAIVYHALTGTTDYERRLQSIDSQGTQTEEAVQGTLDLDSMSPWETEDEASAIECASDNEPLVSLR